HITGPGNATINGGTVNGNSAGREGGGLWNGSGIMTLDAVTIDANLALGDAADDGGAGVFNNGGTLNISNGTIISNNLATGTAASGGGLLSTAGDVTINDASFVANAANRAGGAIEIIDGNLNFTNASMINNDVNGTAGTAAPGNGGGLHVTGTSGTIIIATSTISGNAAANEGGGLWNQNGTVMNVSTSTIDNNSASEGGGVYNNGGAITNIMTSTISGNSASVSGGGVTNNGAVLDLNAVTIAMNSSTGIGGGIDAVNNVTLKNSIVALNTAASGLDVSGNVISNDYNLIGTDDLSVFASQANDLEEVSPLLGPLQDNGGTTFTHQLLNNSPAFDAGDPADLFTDQIGQSVFGTARDMGAFEAQAALSVSEFDFSSVLSVYPNPTNGVFAIEIGESIANDINLKVISITGKLVKEVTLGTGVNTVDINGLASGLYILNLTFDTNQVTHKLILN
ncbi:MAG: T9SS type A sorting domain-containing protein, partial [Algicola sp.]|nr:T9SS type A sorting domain-containing protein [Algicola sp.]